MGRIGSCHCQLVTIAVDFPEHPQPHLCNCSMCAMKASVAIDVPVEALTITAGNEFLSLYKFNTGVAEHYFCSNCGIHMFQRLRSDPSRYGVNGACFHGFGRFDFAGMPVHDGANAHPRDTGLPTRLAGRVRFERE